MASENTTSESPSNFEEVQKESVVSNIPWSKADRKRNKKLRNAGLEYISRSGRTIAAKKQPEVICNCPQQCSIKVPKDVRGRLFTDFYALADANSQNAFLQKYIEIRSVNKRLYNEERKESGRLQRRVTCKYRVPLKLPPTETKLTSELNDTPLENNVSIRSTGPELNDSLAENNASVGNADTTAASEDSDDDNEEKVVDGDLDEDEYGEEKKDEEKDSTNTDHPTEVDTDQPEDLCIRKPTENGIQMDLNLERPAEMKDPVNSAAIKEKSDSNDVGKENEIKVDTPVTSIEKPGEVVLSNGNMRVEGDLIEVCQKAYMNIFAITEKRVRLQREKIIDNLRSAAEQHKAEQEEMENTLSVARELAAGCRPLLQFMDKSNQMNRIPSLPKQLLMAIDNDITLVNNFFRNQLWKPENFNKRYKSDAQTEPDFLSESDILD